MSGDSEKGKRPLGDMTEWDVYNTLTAAIWHNPKSSLETKEDNFVQLHRIMRVAQ